MDCGTPASQRKRPRVSFATAGPSGGSLLEQLFADGRQAGGAARRKVSDAARGSSHLDGGSKKGPPRPSYLHDKIHNDGHKAGERLRRHGGDYADESAAVAGTHHAKRRAASSPRRGQRPRGEVPDFHDADDAQGGDGSGSSHDSASDDSVESNDDNEKVGALPNSTRWASQKASNNGATGDGDDDEERMGIVESNPPSNDRGVYLSQQSRWQDDSADSDSDWEHASDESGRGVPIPRSAPRPQTNRRPASPSSASPRRTALAAAQQRFLAKTRAESAVPEKVGRKRKKLESDDDVSSDDDSQQQQPQDRRSESSSEAASKTSESESDSTIPQNDDSSGCGGGNSNDDEDNDGNSGPIDDGTWRSLGEYIEGMPGNKPVHRSTIVFGMQVIEEEYKRAFEQAARRPTSSSRLMAPSASGGRRTLASVKAQVFKAVRTGLQTTSLPNLYVRLEDPCGPNLAKRTMERRSAALDGAAAALRLAKHRDRFAKEAEVLKGQVDYLRGELEREPSEVYSIHPNLRMRPPETNNVAADYVNSKPPGSSKLQFRQAPVDTSDAFLKSLFPPEDDRHDAPRSRSGSF